MISKKQDEEVTAMREFVITTDSTVDLPKEWLEERNIPTLKLSYTIDGETYPDMEGISKKEFFDRIRRGSLPTTSQVTPGQAMELFEPIIKEGKDIIAVECVSSKLPTIIRRFETIGRSVTTIP